MHVISCFKVPNAVPGVWGRDGKLFLNEHRVSVPIKVVQMDGGDGEKFCYLKTLEDWSN